MVKASALADAFVFLSTSKKCYIPNLKVVRKRTWKKFVAKKGHKGIMHNFKQILNG